MMLSQFFMVQVFHALLVCTWSFLIFFLLSEILQVHLLYSYEKYILLQKKENDQNNIERSDAALYKNVL